MIPYIKKYGEERTRNLVVAALYVATGMEGRKHFRASEIRKYALGMIDGYDEEGSISTETVKRALEPINGEVLEFADRERGLYMLKDIKIHRDLFCRCA